MIVHISNILLVLSLVIAVPSIAVASSASQCKDRLAPRIKEIDAQIKSIQRSRPDWGRGKTVRVGDCADRLRKITDNKLIFKTSYENFAPYYEKEYCLELEKLYLELACRCDGNYTKDEALQDKFLELLSYAKKVKQLAIEHGIKNEIISNYVSKMSEATDCVNDLTYQVLLDMTKNIESMIATGSTTNTSYINSNSSVHATNDNIAYNKLNQSNAAHGNAISSRKANNKKQSNNESNSVKSSEQTSGQKMVYGYIVVHANSKLGKGKKRKVAMYSDIIAFCPPEVSSKLILGDAQQNIHMSLKYHFGDDKYTVDYQDLYFQYWKDANEMDAERLRDIANKQKAGYEYKVYPYNYRALTTKCRDWFTK